MSDRAKACHWKEDDDGNWDTECGETFSFTDGSPHENKQMFCGYCGGRLIEHKLKHPFEP